MPVRCVRWEPTANNARHGPTDGRNARSRRAPYQPSGFGNWVGLVLTEVLSAGASAEAGARCPAVER
jgi:hypothetical protein